MGIFAKLQTGFAIQLIEQANVKDSIDSTWDGSPLAIKGVTEWQRRD